MKRLLYTILLVAAFWYISKFSIVLAIIIGLALMAFILWSRRASILTQMASQAYFVRGDEEKALKNYKTAYKTGIMTSDCKVSFAAFCLYTDRFESCRKLLDQVSNSMRSTEIDVANAKHYLAILEWKEGNLDEAIILMEKVHKDYPSTGTYGSLGAFYIEKAKRDNCFEDYLDFMLEAYDYNDSDKTIVDNLGELYLNLKDYEKAEEVYSKLLEKNQISPVPYYNYALVLKELGKKDEAKENLEKALNCTFTRSLVVSEDMVKKELENL